MNVRSLMSLGVVALTATAPLAQAVAQDAVSQSRVQTGAVTGTEPARSAGSRQDTMTGTATTPDFTVGGIPVHVEAPVTPPYNGAATFSTYAGQPANGRSAILSQSTAGAP